MDNLRLILIVIGAVVLGLIWFLHRPDRGRRPGASRREGRRQEPGLGSEKPQPEATRDPAAAGPPTGPDLSGHASSDGPEAENEPKQTVLPDLGSAFRDGGHDADDQRREPFIGAPDKPRQAEPAVPPEDQWRESEPLVDKGRSAAIANEPVDDGLPRIVTLYVRARGDRKLSGLSLLDAAIKAGLRFGEMKIFHRRHQGATKPVFSMANITRPGSFDPSAWNLFETPGVTLFMTLPGPVSALDAWDAMLATAQRLAELLDADLMDDSQCLLTRQRTSQIREEMREFDRKIGLKT